MVLVVSGGYGWVRGVLVLDGYLAKLFLRYEGLLVVC